MSFKASLNDAISFCKYRNDSIAWRTVDQPCHLNVKPQHKMARLQNTQRACVSTAKSTTEMVKIEPEKYGIKWANLHEHFPDDDIIIILEHGAEHNSYSVFLSLDIPETNEKRDKHRWDTSWITNFVQQMQNWSKCWNNIRCT